MKTKASLKSIAEELGIAPSTISRVVNGSKGFSISEEMRRKILERVKAYGYEPNPFYQSMRKKDNKQIAIMLPDLLRLAGASEISAGVDCLCERMMGHGFSFYYVGRTQKSQRTYGLPLWKVSMAVAVDVHSASLISDLDSSGIPYVSLNGEAGPNGTAVTTDDYANMSMAMERLVALGHRRIGYVNFFRHGAAPALASKEGHPSVRARLKAYADFCAGLGFAPPEESLRCDVEASATVEAGLKKGCTAFVAYNFPLAVEAIAAMRSRGLRLPEDVSVLAFNNPELADFVSPPVTCVETPVEEMGSAAAEILLGKHLDGAFEKRRAIAFKGRLIERSSTGPCPAGNAK